VGWGGAGRALALVMCGIYFYLVNQGGLLALWFPAANATADFRLDIFLFSLTEVDCWRPDSCCIRWREFDVGFIFHFH
jgi:hypothetical protein